MIDKRRDKKGRNLLNGELQRSDGRYEFRYLDSAGKRRSVYSWRLVASDKQPVGKKELPPLREMESKIQSDLVNGIKTFEAQTTTLDEFFEQFMSGKSGIKEGTRQGYKRYYNVHIQKRIGSKKIAQIRRTDIKRLYAALHAERNLKASSVALVHAVLNQIFKEAIRDDIVRTNPTDGVYKEFKNSVDIVPKKKKALSVGEQTLLLDYCLKSYTRDEYAALIVVLVGTGLRLGECLALRWEDCDFDNGIIYINLNLVHYYDSNGTIGTHIGSPKSKSGVRVIPMLKEVREILSMLLEKQKYSKTSIISVDGYRGFVFTNKKGNVYNVEAVRYGFKKIRKHCNNIETKLAQAENRAPLLLPHFSPHTLRHTFCTRFCENESNLKIIQEIMGHANIRTTMDVYNEATKESKIESFKKLETNMGIFRSFTPNFTPDEHKDIKTYENILVNAMS